ncbi:MAG TPA: class I SAM-dependent methyltransferase [Myxococcaceae bacterium]|nr:class I SAM-dependent methyltransferase [Myxococcaceae bacterium]
MAEGGAQDVFAVAPAYEAYIGRWSRPVAREFVRWLGVPPGRRWLDVGCGTGALTEVLVEVGAARAVVGVDRSGGFVQHARHGRFDAEVTFVEGDAQALPVPSAEFDAVVSGLVLNFVPEPRRMVAEMVRAARPGSTVALYVWDHAGRMELIARFWDVAREIDPTAATLDESDRFREACAPERLETTFRGAGLVDVLTRAIDVPTVFQNFEDYWRPFLGGQGPAPAYLASVPEDRRAQIREGLRARLPVGADGAIRLSARAWAVRGTRAGSASTR